MHNVLFRYNKVEKKTIWKDTACQAGQSRPKSLVVNTKSYVLMPYLDVVLQVEEERQLEAMLWPNFSEGRHSPKRGVLQVLHVKQKLGGPLYFVQKKHSVTLILNTT